MGVEKQLLGATVSFADAGRCVSMTDGQRQESQLDAEARRRDTGSIGDKRKPHMDLARQLAANAVSRRFEDLAPSTVDATVDAVIDSLACALAGTQAPGLEPARGALARWGRDGCSVWGGFGRAPAPFAAFLNAVSMHALDYDDTDDKVPLHACGMVLPGLFADVEENRPGSTIPQACSGTLSSVSS